MISFDEALAIIASAARPLGTEAVTLAAAAGRVLSEPVIAAIDSPRSDVSAMDGYAVYGADLSEYPVSLRIVGESFPGRVSDGKLDPGTCVRLFTGAPLPAGADRIVIQEQVRREGDTANIDSDPGPATWVRQRGKDFRSGDEILPAGRRLDPSALIAAAGADAAEVRVFERPRLALIGTGDELVEPGRARASTLAVPDSASLGVAALAEQWGAQVVGHRRAPDDLEQLRAAADEAVASAGVIVVIGGASVGERDFAKAMFEQLGLEMLFSRVSMRPGKPAWFGRVGEKLVLGLPGNPTSALVTARLLLAPLLAAMQGRPADQALAWEPARLATPLRECDQRETFHRAVLSAGDVSPVGFQESHAQKALAEADALLRQSEHSPPIPAGETVQVLRL
jgi:molybdopterin molybdotransferase